MVSIPDSLSDVVTQAAEATKKALAAGQTRLQIEILLPELKPLPIAEQLLLEELSDLGLLFKVFFSDAGAAALARRDWGESPHRLLGIEELWEPIAPEDQAFLVVAPTPVEAEKVAKMGEQVGDRPFILLLPKLQDPTILGIGYAGRRFYTGFIETLETSYYLRPLEQGAVLRSYPDPWQVWWETSEDHYELLASEQTVPRGDRLDEILAQVAPEKPQQGGFWQVLQRLFR